VVLPTVAVVKGQRSHETVVRAVELSGGVGHLADKPVLIKVNFICEETWDSGATTDPLLVEALIQTIEKINQDIAVVECDANMTNADSASVATGMLEMCERNGVPFKNLKMVAESHIVDAAKLKTHSLTRVTLGMKNLFGLLPNKWKFRYHRKGIDNVIVDINSVLSPSLVVIDGFVGMEGKGPVHGDPVKMDLVIAGQDVVATDIVGATIMGFDPREIRHIAMSIDRGIGGWEYQLAGERLEDVSRKFRFP
jgi:uncharacterized protein (DUF362 family)